GRDGGPRGSHGRHLERLALLRPADLAAADALHADAGALHAAVHVDLDVLQVRPEGAPADAGDLAADAAEVLGLAAPGVLVAQHRLLSANGTLHAHDATCFRLRCPPRRSGKAGSRNYPAMPSIAACGA